MEEFNLSEKIVSCNDDEVMAKEPHIYTNDVKEFIKKIELENKDLMNDVLDLIDIHKGTKINLKSKLVMLFAAHFGERQKLAGNNLI